MNMKFLSGKIGALVAVMALSTATASAATCEKIVGGQKSPYTGDSLKSLQVDKDALGTINSQFPNLHVTEEVLSGNLQTCSGAGCKDNFITCK
jgi:hypothetical protein